MSKTKILIVDDHRVVIEGVKGALRAHPEFEVAGQAFDGLQAVELTNTLKPDIVIMDIAMPNLNGIEATNHIKRLNPEIGIIIFTMYSNKEFVIDLFKSGISAYVLKDDPLSDLILAIKAVKSGGTYFSTFAPETLLRHVEDLEERKKRQDGFENLSRREREVFCLLADGLTIKGIAGELYISPKTVESHKYNIMKKLRVKTTVDLTKIAISKDMIKV
ncbi:MAG: response regulator transcription factor [Desulfobacterales bacterium]|nr:MAG: response regulator transcription factor [Desulfobacterales bacterium]